MRLRKRELLRSDVLANPYPFYAQLRTAPTEGAAGSGAVQLFRYDETLRALQHRALSPAATSSSFDRRMYGLVPQEQHDEYRRYVATRSSLLFYSNGLRHAELVRLLQGHFTRAAVTAMRPGIDKLVDGLLAVGQHRDSMDVVEDLASPLPVLVVLELLGLPSADFRVVRRLCDDSVKATELPDRERLRRGREALEELLAYMRASVAERRKHPREDLVSMLVNAADQGLLTDSELLATCCSILVAGYATTSGLIANGVLALVRHPDQLALLHRQPTLVPGAIDELLRYDSPIQLATRVATRNVGLHDRTIRKGQIVECWIGAANRDPAEFEQPDRLDVRRSSNRHLAFSLGRHYCLGAALARVEGEAAIGAIVRRFPRLRLATDQIEWRQSAIFRCPASLPVDLRMQPAVSGSRR